LIKVVLDTNVFIAAAISPNGPTGELVRRALSGEVELIVSEHLLDELASRLERDKFRRWFSRGEAEALVDAVTLVGTFVDDRSEQFLPLVCSDPDDNFLAAITYDADANMLVSGDKAVLRIEHPGVSTYSPAQAIEALDYRHKWGEGYLKGDIEDAERQIDIEGHRKIIEAYSTFSAALYSADAADLLPFIVVPETLSFFLRDMASLREVLNDRGLGTRPMYMSPEIAYLKLPPDPGVMVRVGGDGVELPPDTIFATMQRCPHLPAIEGLDFDHWRVFGIGAPVEPERIRRSVNQPK